MPARNDRSARWNRYWDKKSRTYDREIGFSTATCSATPASGSAAATGDVLRSPSAPASTCPSTPTPST